MGADSTSMRKRLWTETDGAEQVLRREAEQERRYAEIKAGLAKCPVCKGAAEIVRFGLSREGVWVGCDRTEKCCRYIEYHSRGWSVEETARDWDHRNRGLRKVVRLIKRWFTERFGRMARAERCMKSERMRGERRKRQKGERCSGGEWREREKVGGSFGRKGNEWGLEKIERQKGERKDE